MSCLYVFTPPSPPKPTTTCTNGLITAQWPEPHTTPHTNKRTHHTPQCDTLPFSELCCVLDDTVATNNPNETPQSSMTPLPASLMEIVIVTRSKIGVHPLQRSEVFRLTRIQAGQNFVVKQSLVFCKNCNVVLCNMFQRIAPGRTRQGSWLSGALFLNNALPTFHNKSCTSQS